MALVRLYSQFEAAGKALDLEAYSINRMAARAGRFMRAQPELAKELASHVEIGARPSVVAPLR